MDKVKILKLCNEIEDVACDIARITMNDIVSAESRMIFDKAKEIAAEITAPLKSNGDRIRQMTDEELAEWISVISAEYSVCRICAHDADCNIYGAELSCEEGIAKWLQKEAENNDKR